MVHKLMLDLLCDIRTRTRVVDHRCRNRACCNPEHLQVATQSENIKLSYKRGSR